MVFIRGKYFEYLYIITQYLPSIADRGRIALINWIINIINNKPKYNNKPIHPMRIIAPL